MQRRQGVEGKIAGKLSPTCILIFPLPIAFVFVKSFDSHLNMVLQDVVETLTIVEIEETTKEEIIDTKTRNIELLFVRGDGVILVSPPLRTV